MSQQTLSRSLNVSSAAVLPSGGAVTLDIPLPPVGRTWQGTVGVPGSPASASWTINVGGLTVGQFQGSGPFGPIQAQSGQAVQVVGSAAGGMALSALLQGIDDPSDRASPFFGPSALPSPSSAQVVEISGQPVQVANSARLTPNGLAANGDSIYPAAPSGYVYRIYSFLAAVATVPEITQLGDHSSGSVIAVAKPSTAYVYDQSSPVGPVDVAGPLYVINALNNQDINWVLGLTLAPTQP